MNPKDTPFSFAKAAGRGMILGFSLVLSAAVSRSWAADAVLEKARGQVFFKNKSSGKFFQARPGKPIAFGDEIKTGPGAVAHIVFPDGNAVLVKEKSRVALRGDKKNPLVDFEVGEFLIGLKKKLAAGRTFKVKTPVAVAAVRGTLFWGLSDEQKTTTYACFSGSIQIESGGKTVALEPGKTVKIPFGAPMEAVKPANIPPDYVKTFAVDDSLQGLDQIKE